MAVKVKKHRLVACYQPIWGKHEEDMRKYRENLEEQLALKRRNEWLLIGGDFNAQVGSRELRVETETCGRFGIGKMNDAGRYLISWMEINGLCWIDSYFDHQIGELGITKETIHGMKLMVLLGQRMKE